MTAQRPLTDDCGPRLVVFDKDGVLVDFHRLWAEVTHARVAALVRLGLPPARAAEVTSLLGLSTEGRVDPAGLLASGSRNDSAIVAASALHHAGMPWSDARAAAFAAFDDADAAVPFEEACRPLPGVPEALRALHAGGWRLAIATTDQTEGACAFVRNAGLEELFAAIVGVDQVAASKPHPAMFERACALAECPPSAAIMVGDLDLDLRMGRAGGARATVGVLSGVGDATLLSPHADRVVADVRAIADWLLGVPA